MPDGHSDLVRKHDIGRDGRISHCTDALSGGRRNVGVSADKVGGQSDAQMVLPVFYHPDDWADSAFGIIHCDAGADDDGKRNGDFRMGNDFSVCHNRSKHFMLVFLIGGGEKEAGGLWPFMEMLESVCPLHLFICRALFRKGSPVLCDKRPDGHVN